MDKNGIKFSGMVFSIRTKAIIMSIVAAATLPNALVITAFLPYLIA